MSDYSTLLLTYSPSLYWTLDLATGATDQSTGGNSGTGAGSISIGGHSATYPPITGAASNTCTDFDASDDRVTSSYSPFTNGTTRTFLGWFNRDSAGFHVVIGSLGADWFRIIVWNDQSLRLQANKDTGLSVTLTAASSITNGAWTFWAVVFNETADTAEGFINGVSGGSQAYTQAYGAAPGALEVGARSGSTDAFDGKMGHVAVVQSALSAAQILTLYNYGITGNPNAAVKPSFVHAAGRGQ